MYWSQIDKRFFGDGNLDDLLQRLSIEEKVAMHDYTAEIERGGANYAKPDTIVGHLRTGINY